MLILNFSKIRSLSFHHPKRHCCFPFSFIQIKLFTHYDSSFSNRIRFTIPNIEIINLKNIPSPLSFLHAILLPSPSLLSRATEQRGALGFRQFDRFTPRRGGFRLGASSGSWVLRPPSFRQVSWLASVCR